jgi:hypothetical protein
MVSLKFQEIAGHVLFLQYDSHDPSVSIMPGSYSFIANLMPEIVGPTSVELLRMKFRLQRDFGSKHSVCHLRILSAWSRILFENLIVSQLVKKFPDLIDRIPKNAPLHPIVSLLNSVHTLTPSSFMIHFDSILQITHMPSFPYILHVPVSSSIYPGYMW